MKFSLVLVAVVLAVVAGGCSRKAPPPVAVAPTPAFRPVGSTQDDQAVNAALLRNRQEQEDVIEEIARREDAQHAKTLYPDEPIGRPPFEQRVADLLAKQEEQVRTGREIDLFPGEPRPVTDGLPRAKAEQVQKDWLEKRIAQEMTPTPSPESQRTLYVAQRAEERSRKRLEELKQEMRSRGLSVPD